MRQPNQGERRQLCVELAALTARCFRAGLYLTAQNLNVACEQIGYECVEQFEKEDCAVKRTVKRGEDN